VEFDQIRSCAIPCPPKKNCTFRVGGTFLFIVLDGGAKTTTYRFLTLRRPTFVSRFSRASGIGRRLSDTFPDWWNFPSLVLLNFVGSSQLSFIAPHSFPSPPPSLKSMIGISLHRLASYYEREPTYFFPVYCLTDSFFLNPDPPFFLKLWSL